jgi:hypothetical protein
MSLALALVLVLTWATGCGLSEFPIEKPSAGGEGGAGGSDNPPPGTGGGPATGDGSGGGGAVKPPAGGAGGAGGGPSPARDAGPSGSDAPGTGGAPASPGGDGVTIAGKFVPRDKAIVFLQIGHSNMAGRTDTPAELRPMYFETHPQLWAYGKGGAWRPAREPLSGDRLTGTTKAGPGMAILRTALALAPDAYMISIGRGHDGSIGGWCRNFRKGALLYDFVMGPAVELKGKVTFGAIFAMLGVNEFRRDNANIPKFNECLEGIARDMRTDLGAPELPFLLGDWEAGATGDFDPRQPYAITTRAEMREAMMNIPQSGLIPSDALPMSDDHHYNLLGYKIWVERGFEILTKNALVPWANR